MLKVYDGEVFVIDLEEFQENARQTLDLVTKNPDWDKMVFLLKKAGSVFAATGLTDFLKNNIVIKTFSDIGGDIFVEARDYCKENHVSYDTYFPVLDDVGECVYLLHYVENKLYRGTATSEIFWRYDLDVKAEQLEYSLLDPFEEYVFLEIEEYTYALAMLLAKRYPSKKISFLDRKISYFPELLDIAIFVSPMEDDIVDRFWGRRCLWITSDGKMVYTDENQEQVRYNQIEEGCVIRPPEYAVDIYNSVRVLYSIYRCSIIECFGEKNKNSTIFLFDCDTGIEGLGSIVIHTYLNYLYAKRRDWKFVVDLSHKPNQYLGSGSENMWDYFFEPLSDITVEEAYESASVIRCSANHISFVDDLFLDPNRRREHFMDLNKVMKTIKCNADTEKRLEGSMPGVLKKGIAVLGVLLRGTDFREEACRARGRSTWGASLQKMIAKCRFIMDLYGYEYIFLATEDLGYYEKMKEEFGDRCLSIDQKRVSCDYKKEHKWCTELLEVENGKEFGRRYLSIIYSLSKCRSLLTNIETGTAILAMSLNDSQYEYLEIVSP